MPGPGNDLIDDREIEAVTRVLRSGHLGRYGPDDDPTFSAEVLTLEQSVAERVGARRALAVNSGTSAIWTLLSSLGIGPGDEVIVPGFTFVASITAIVHTGATPVLAEVDDTFNLDPIDVERRITPRTRAVLAVHMLGAAADLGALAEICDRHGVLLVEDAAQAFGASLEGRGLGAIGVGGAFSFNVFKTITCGDGGMLVTSDEALYQTCFALHDQGHLPLRRGIEIGQRSMMGMNFRMTELQGAVLNVQLSKLDRILALLRTNKTRLRLALEATPGLTFRRLVDPVGDAATHLVVSLPTAEVASKVAAALGTKTLDQSGWHVYSRMEHVLEGRTVSRLARVVSGFGIRRGDLPQTDELLSRSITLGIGVVDPGLGSAFGLNVRSTLAEIERVADALDRAVRPLVS